MLIGMETAFHVAILLCGPSTPEIRPCEALLFSWRVKAPYFNQCVSVRDRTCEIDLSTVIRHEVVHLQL